MCLRLLRITINSKSIVVFFFKIKLSEFIIPFKIINSQSESFADLLLRGLPLNSKLYWIIPSTTGLIFIFYIISFVKPYWARKKNLSTMKKIRRHPEKNGVYMRKSINHGASLFIKPYRIIIIIQENEAKVFSTICKPAPFISQRISQVGAGMGKFLVVEKTSL